MSMMTHESRWRLLVGAAPVIGVAFFAWAAAQGEADVARSPTARAILAAVAALGTAVAWWTAHQLRAKPTVSVSKAGALAQGGQLAASVTLRGRARALLLRRRKRGQRNHCQHSQQFKNRSKHRRVYPSAGSRCGCVTPLNPAF